jgi:hypothetical protein
VGVDFVVTGPGLRTPFLEGDGLGVMPLGGTEGGILGLFLGRSPPKMRASCWFVEGLRGKRVSIALLVAGFGGEGVVWTLSGGGDGLVSLAGLEDAGAGAQMWLPS